MQDNYGIVRLETGIAEIDEMLSGGIPRGFFVALVGEPGTGKTVFSIHFIGAGLENGEPCIYVTTEESRESIMKQAEMFNFDFRRYAKKGTLIIIDAFGGNDKWALSKLDVGELTDTIIAAKKELGYGYARLVIDSISAFWLSSPALARRHAYTIKNVLYKWKFTTLGISQYAVTTSGAFGFGVEHIADGIIRFKKQVVNGRLKRYILIEKMRQTPHDLRVHEIDIVDGVGLVIVGPIEQRRVSRRMRAYSL